MEEMLENMEQFDDVRLTSDESICFPGPEKLLRSQIEGFDASLWDELCIAHPEGDPAGAALEGDPAFVAACESFRRVRLVADQSVCMPGKESLMRRAPVFSLRRVVWSVASAAAVVAFVVMFQPASRQVAVKDTKTASAVEDSVRKPLQNAIQQPQPAMAQAVEPQWPAAKKMRRQAEAQAPEVVLVATANVPEVETPAKESVFQGVAGTDMVAAIVAQPSLGDVNRLLAKFEANPDEAVEKESILEKIAGQEVIQEAPRKTRRWLAGVFKPIDYISVKGVIAFNKLTNTPTTVVKQYDKQGKLVHYSVESSRLEIERNY